MAKLHLNNPQKYCDPALREKYADDPQFWERYKRTVVFFRRMMVAEIISVNKINIDLIKHNDEHLLELMALQEGAQPLPSSAASSAGAAGGEQPGDELQDTPTTPGGSVPEGTMITNPLMQQPDDQSATGALSME
eukprot:COSAG01_NODE_15674_length_1311_cov_95.386139_2_plen_135_part_00